MSYWILADTPRGFFLKVNGLHRGKPTYALEHRNGEADYHKGNGVASPVLRRLFAQCDHRFRGGVIAAESRGSYEKLLDAKSRLRVIEVERYYQQPATPAATLARATLILRAMDAVVDSTVLLLGDDDLLSVPLHESGLAVTVAEVAPNVCAALRRSLPLGDRFALREADITRSRPSESFGVVATDPPYTGIALVKFLSYAVRSVRPGGLLALSFADYGANRVVSHLVGQGIVTYHSHFPLLNAYLNPVTGGVDNNLSDFYLLRRTSRTLSETATRCMSRRLNSTSKTPEPVVTPSVIGRSLFPDCGRLGVQRFIDLD